MNRWIRAWASGGVISAQCRDRRKGRGTKCQTLSMKRYDCSPASDKCLNIIGVGGVDSRDTFFCKCCRAYKSVKGVSVSMFPGGLEQFGGSK